MDTTSDALPRRTPPPRPVLHPKETLQSILKHVNTSAASSAMADNGLLSVESPLPRETSSYIKHHRSYTPPKRVLVPLPPSTSSTQRQLFHRQQKHKPPSIIQITPTPTPQFEDDNTVDETTMLHRRLLHAATVVRTQRNRRGGVPHSNSPPRAISVPFRRSIQAPSLSHLVVPR
ncbi:hypothetical protein, variant [Aphanomyces invadans]|uniref:Uncharacterized protein n=1 Tax=Aphanomyces invadans TaxID=157072 RepID=A0A024UMV4_9STRA|nr:hypothetical protein, variant [Aphanomyces invadans]ETW07495.1 hypothetical protein, variant [Aphanomyces invadans]|eukprot:XP_008863588.1 hypothetical protein, variant [Aphanomyces invadans]